MAMKKLMRSLVFLCCVAAIVSCAKNESGNDPLEPELKRPFTDFTIVPGDDPFSFEFQNKSANYKTLEWRFGDDSLSTEVSPKHTFLKTGIYEVNLKATSEVGTTARKLLVININADSVAKITAQKTGVANEVKLNLSTKATIASLLWDFGDNTTSNTVSPTKTYESGKMYTLKLKVITNKGSVVEVSKFVTTEGTVADVTTTASLSVLKENGGGVNANEGSLKLIDNNINTKYLIGNFTSPIWAQQLLPSPQIVKIYSITSGNDGRERDPQQWTIEGSNDGSAWEVLDTRDEQFPSRKLTRYFSISNPKSYAIYRWNIKKNQGNSSLFQVGEWRLYK
jgi:PKD repeat protein